MLPDCCASGGVCFRSRGRFAPAGIRVAGGGGEKAEAGNAMHFMLDPADFKQAIQAIDALGATPAVLVRVIALAKDPNTDLETLCALLRNDGPLAADIIRIGNSPYYSPALPFGNLTDAVHQIGMRELIWVIDLSLARQLFARDLPGYGITAYDYWNGAVAAALMMEALARYVGLDPEDAYTIGILHAIGRILIDRVIEERGFSLYWESPQPITDWERGAVGFDSGEAGAMLLEHWSFPPTTCDVIRWQASREKVVEEVSLLGALQFTLRLLPLTGLDFAREGWQLPAEDPFLQASGLTSAMAPIIEGCHENFQRLLKSVHW